MYIRVWFNNVDDKATLLLQQSPRCFHQIELQRHFGWVSNRIYKLARRDNRDVFTLRANLLIQIVYVCQRWLSVMIRATGNQKYSRISANIWNWVSTDEWKLWGVDLDDSIGDFFYSKIKIFFFIILPLLVFHQEKPYHLLYKRYKRDLLMISSIAHW